MNIKCLIIGKDRHVNRVNVDARKSEFTFNSGLYTVPKEAVNLTEFADGKTECYPELVYIEGEALPVNQKDGSIATFLEATVIENALKQTSRSKSDFMSVVYDYMRNPPKLVMLLFVGIIALAVVGSLLQGGFF